MKKIYPKQVGLLLLFVLALTNNIHAQKKTIGIIGSSTAACYGVTADSCWSSLMNHFYYEVTQVTNNYRNIAWNGWNIYLAMPTGYTPPPGRPAPDPIGNITSLVNYYNVDVVIVNLPTNGYNLWTVREVMDCYRVIKNFTISKGKTIYATTTQPRHNYPDYDDQVERDKLIELRDSITKEFGPYTIDFWTDFANPDGSIKREYDQGDRIHLNDTAHLTLYQRVMQKNVLVEQAALPVYNLGFQSAFKEGKVLLNWKNDPDNQVESFELQKSSDGKNFNAIFSVKASVSTIYSFVDDKPAEGNNFYRLQVYFRSGRKDFSQVLKQSIRNGSFKIDKVYRSSQGLQIEWQSKIRQNYSFKLFNTIGSVIGSSQIIANPGNNQFNLKLNGNISAGSYFLIMENTTGEREVWPMMIQN